MHLTKCWGHVICAELRGCGSTRVFFFRFFNVTLRRKSKSVCVCVSQVWLPLIYSAATNDGGARLRCRIRLRNYVKFQYCHRRRDLLFSPCFAPPLKKQIDKKFSETRLLRKCFVNAVKQNSLTESSTNYILGQAHGGKT